MSDMEIIDKFASDVSLEVAPITRIFPGADSVEMEMRIATEHHMSVLVNTIPTFEVVCSPDHLPQLVLGRLITEGIIESKSEVAQIYVCDHGTRAEVMLFDENRANFKKKAIEKVPTCCTGNRTLNEYFLTDEMPGAVCPIDWSEDWVFEMANFFKNDSPAHKKSFGTHSCYISWAGQDFSESHPIICEDLGRHNALDKAIGCALERGVDLRRVMLFTSGRLPIDMVTKVIRAKIPILVSKAVPTTSALELAEQSKLTLICSAYPDAFDVYLRF